MKIHSVGAKLLHVDRQMDSQVGWERDRDRHDKKSSHFSQFCKCPLNKQCTWQQCVV